jgi:peptidoglycan/xylan/chitin deacetylase (PgdA/CDA1 family)
MSPGWWLLVLMATGLLSLRYAWWRKPVDWAHPRILMYHMVSPHLRGGRFNGLRVTPGNFEKQLRWLRKRGFHFFTVSELWTQRHELPARSVALTFDDGYRDNLTNMLPLLEKYDARATVYVVVDRHDREWSTTRKASHDNGELRREAKLSEGELLALARSGRVEIGAHTLTHPDLRGLPASRLDDEIRGSAEHLATMLGVPVRSFAYPFGFFDDAAVNAVSGAGYMTAVTTVTGIADLAHVDGLRIPRVKISGRDNLLAFVMRIRGGRRGWKR